MLVAGSLAMGLLAIVVAMGAMIAEERRQQRRDAHPQAAPRREPAGV
jgi:heme exporter protein D